MTTIYPSLQTVYSEITASIRYPLRLQTKAIALRELVRNLILRRTFARMIFLQLYRIMCYTDADNDISSDELEEKARLITQVLELQNTLDGS